MCSWSKVSKQHHFREIHEFQIRVAHKILLCAPSARLHRILNSPAYRSFQDHFAFVAIYKKIHIMNHSNCALMQRDAIFWCSSHVLFVFIICAYIFQ
jgi:hypothetical protein